MKIIAVALVFSCESHCQSDRFITGHKTVIKQLLIKAAGKLFCSYSARTKITFLLVNAEFGLLELTVFADR